MTNSVSEILLESSEWTTERRMKQTGDGPACAQTPAGYHAEFLYPQHFVIGIIFPKATHISSFY